jgi:hypothetical protein
MMTTAISEPELLRCFREVDRDDVELAPDLAFPLALDEALAWSVGPRAFIIFRDRLGARPRGIVFHRNSGTLPDAAAMCEWCRAVRGNGGVKLMSVRAGERRRLGLYLCSDLGCVARARGARPRRRQRPRRQHRAGASHPRAHRRFCRAPPLLISGAPPSPRAFVIDARPPIAHCPARQSNSVRGQGKPVQSRRGPATVCGEAPLRSHS